MMARILFLLFLVLSSPVRAETRLFSMPIDCELGKNCWIAQYVDVNSAEDQDQDFMCTSKSYEGHKGTDFAIRSRVEMALGVNVLAAADGHVLRVREGESDAFKDRQQLDAMSEAKRDCGNGALVDHGDGYQALYCHLKNGSLVVKPGQKIKAGDVLGQVGQSGRAEFTHLHFTVFKDGKVIDPFTGFDMGAGCEEKGQSLWDDGVEYNPFSVFDGGFEAGQSDFEEIKRGRVPFAVMKRDVDALVYWVGFFQGQKGDRIHLQVLTPDNEVLAEREIEMQKNRARQFYYTGRSIKGRGLKPGIYKGRAIFSRKGVQDYIVQHEVVVR